LWAMLQSMPQYAGKTGLIVSTDHGRGASTTEWTDHDAVVPGSGQVWIAVMGPETPPLGVRDSVVVTQAQIAATIAAMVGQDYSEASTTAAPPLPVFGR
jgi:hypothetical protein